MVYVRVSAPDEVQCSKALPHSRGLWSRAVVKSQGAMRARVETKASGNSQDPRGSFCLPLDLLLLVHEGVTVRSNVAGRKRARAVSKGMAGIKICSHEA